MVRRDRRAKLAALPIGLAVAVLLAGCSEQSQRGFLPGERGTSDIGDTILGFWTNTWAVALCVGAVAWGLILWATVVYRRRRGDRRVPRQTRYQMPIEILFTVLPVVVVVGIFSFTAYDETGIEQVHAADRTDVHIEVYGKQWSWDFNYLDVGGSPYAGGVYTEGIQAQEVRDAEGDLTGEVDYDALPKLFLPVGSNVVLDLKSRDVAHSFYVPAFHYKKDDIPGRTNHMSFVPGREGTYIGKCAELCGEYHGMMLFQVEVVSQQEYNAYISQLREQGNVGRRGDEYNRESDAPGTAVPEIVHDGDGESD